MYRSLFSLGSPNDHIRWMDHAINSAFRKIILLNLLNIHYIATSPVFDKYQKNQSVQREVLTRLTPAFAEGMLLWLRVSDQIVIPKARSIIYLEF